MGTRLPARKADADKQECTIKVIAVLVKDIDGWVNKNKEYDGIPDVDMIVEQHGNFKKRILTAFHETIFRGIDFKVLAQIQGLHVRIDKVKNVSEYKEYL